MQPGTHMSHWTQPEVWVPSVSQHHELSKGSFLDCLSAGLAWIAASIPVSVAKLRKEGVAVPKIKEVSMPIITPMNIQAPVPIQASKASVVAIRAPVLVVVMVVAPVEAIRVPESVVIQAQETMQVFLAEGWVVLVVVEFPVESHCWLLEGNLKHTAGNRVSPCPH